MTSLNQRIKILEVYSGIETSVISISDVRGGSPNFGQDS